MRQAHKRGDTEGFSPLANHPFSFRTRFARKGKWRFGIAARPPQRVSKSGLPPQKGAQRAPAQHPCEVATIFFRVLTDNVRARIPAPGRSVAFMQTTSASLASTAPPPPGSGAQPNRRDVIANQIFPQDVDKFVCGRGQPRASPGGGDSQEGAKRPLLCACRAQRHRFHRPQGGSWRVGGHIPAREARALSFVFSGKIPPGA